MSFRIGRRTFIKLALGAGLAAAYPLLIERYLVQANRYRVPVPNLPQAFKGYTIVQLTDLHYGLLMPLGLIRRIVARANRVPRDLTVCTGDYVHERNSTAQIDTVWPVLAGLQAPDGVLSVLGNHDHWADTQRSAHWLAQTGQDLRHRVRMIERGESRLWFAGAGDLWEDPSSLDELLAAIPEEDCRIVLAHNPDTADSAYSARVDLFIAGHTHGGQVRLPFVGAPIVPAQNPAYASGLQRSPKGTPVFISRGLGWAVLPVRFNCPPEIAVLELV